MAISTCSGATVNNVGTGCGDSYSLQTQAEDEEGNRDENQANANVLDVAFADNVRLRNGSTASQLACPQPRGVDDAPCPCRHSRPWSASNPCLRITAFVSSGASEMQAWREPTFLNHFLTRSSRANSVWQRHNVLQRPSKRRARRGGGTAHHDCQASVPSALFRFRQACMGVRRACTPPPNSRFL